MKKTVICALSAAVLVACGGGSESTPAAATPVIAVAGPVVTVATPSATGSVADANSAGKLAMLAFDNKGATTNQDVSITGSGTTSVMTFSSPAFTVTGATGASPVFSAVALGAVRADGNVVSVCTAGTSTTRGGNGTNAVTVAQGQRVFLSANFTAVSDRNELASKSFTEFACAETAKTAQFTINADLSLTQSDGTKQTAAQAAFYSSASGFTGTNGGNYKSLAYKRVIGGVTRYVIVNINRDVNPAAEYVTVAFQN